VLAKEKTSLEGAIHCADVHDFLPLIPDGSVDLSIIDPPYFEVSKENWDNQWSSLSDYLIWTQGWIKEVARITRYSGSVYVYGCSKNLLTLSSLGTQFQEIGFEFRQEIIVDKGIKSVAGRTSKLHKLFPMVSENILYFVKDAKPFVKSILVKAQKDKGLTPKEINEAMGLKSNGGGNWTKYAGETNFPLLPTKQHWDRLREILGIDVNYQQIGVTFNPEFGITNVWKDIDFYSETRIHPTQKPQKLAQRLISVSSNEQDLVLDLFSGSGNVSKVAAQMNRRFIGIDSCFYEGRTTASNV